MELSQLHGVGKSRLTAMRAAGIFSLRDLFYTTPVRYRDAGSCLAVADARPGQRAAFRLRRIGEPRITRFGKTCRVACRFADDSGEIEGVWFNQPWMKTNLMKRSDYLLYGLVDRLGDGLQLKSPSVEDAERIVPVYRPIAGLPQKVHGALVRQALPEVGAHCGEWLSPRLREAHGLMDAPHALRALHAPERMEDVERAGRRLAFEQMLLHQAAVRMLKSLRKRGAGMRAAGESPDAYWRSLPFAPTQAQRRTLGEIAGDMAGDTAMTRMVQGDVGCGKTAIAMGAIWLCARSGYQAAMMAPTEILARQHYEGAKPYLESQGISCGLLVGGLSAGERRHALNALKNGEWQVVIGTHALIGKGVAYHKLGLCITDEQHRFGVSQRTALLNKGRQEEADLSRFPHLLVMSATPIPRSLALVLYGDLDISLVDELPPGRLPVTTRIVPEEKRGDMYGFLRAELAAGQRAYIVCPLIAESEEEDGGGSEEDAAANSLKAVETHCAELRQGALRGFALGLTHGRQSSEEKEAVIGAFVRGEIQVLVATTVIEVGVNVPAATIMVIENADQYGLAQLHQLRGRVGRGSRKSWCFLLAKENERLHALTQTADGFEIARKDLELRGPGEILGTAQHGATEGRLALMGDMSLLYEAAACAEALETDAALSEEWEALRVRAEAYLERVSQTVSIS